MIDLHINSIFCDQHDPASQRNLSGGYSKTQVILYLQNHSTYATGTSHQTAPVYLMSVMYGTGDYEIRRSFTAVVTPSNSFVEDSKTVRATPFTRKRSIDHCPYVIDDYEDGCIFFPDLKKLYEPIAEARYDPGADFKDKPHSELAIGLFENDSIRDQKYKYELLLKQCMASAVASSLHSESLNEKVSILENENEVLKGALKKANEEMERAKIITANTAHDLKSPLQTLILGEVTINISLSVGTFD